MIRFIIFMLLACAICLPASAGELTAQHYRCDLAIDANNVAYCALPGVPERLVCERSIGMPRPQCITADGWPADCFYQSWNGNPTEYIYCSIANVPARSENESRRVVITDAHFGGAKQVVRKPAGTLPAAPAPALPLYPLSGTPAPAGRPSDDVASARQLYEAAMHDCDEARGKVLHEAVQSDGAGVIGSLLPMLERACVPPRPVRADATLRQKYCDFVTGQMQSIAMQFPESRERVLQRTRFITNAACSKPLP